VNGALKNRAGSCPMSVPPPFWSRGDVKKVTSKLEPEEDVPDPEETTLDAFLPYKVGPPVSSVVMSYLC